MSFGTGLHIMLALAYNEGKRLPSSALASSIHANPVTVRRVLAQLSEAGLIDTQTGPGGGAMLARKASKITVQDVFHALGDPPFIEGHGKEPQQHCIVSACMPKVIERLNQRIGDKAANIMRKTTLRALVDEEVG